MLAHKAITKTRNFGSVRERVLLRSTKNRAGRELRHDTWIFLILNRNLCYSFTGSRMDSVNRQSWAVITTFPPYFCAIYFMLLIPKP